MWVTRLEGGPRKVNHAAVAINDKIYSFGGYCSGEDFETNRPMEVSVLDTDTLRWKALSPNQGFDEDSEVSQVPFQRYGHSAVVWEQHVLIWGGRNDKTGSCNVLYCYDTVQGVWTRPAVQGRLPTKRDGHAAALLGSDMYVFGGFEERGDRFTSDLYRLHIPTLTWSPITPINPRPMPRDFATMETVGHRLLVWGGRGDLDEDGQHTGSEKYENFLYMYDTRINLWLHVGLDYAPPARRSHASFVYKDKMYVFGGYNGRDHFSDLWMFDQWSMRWTEIGFSSSDIIPNPRRRMCCCVHGDRLYMFGGTSPVALTSAPVTADSGLLDHDDLFVYEFMPRLLTLARVAVLRYRLRIDHLPLVLKVEFLVNTTHNNLAKQLRSRTGNHSG